jgi:hypothetical protein
MHMQLAAPGRSWQALPAEQGPGAARQEAQGTRGCSERPSRDSLVQQGDEHEHQHGQAEEVLLVLLVVLVGRHGQHGDEEEHQQLQGGGDAVVDEGLDAPARVEEERAGAGLVSVWGSQGS